MERTVLFRNWGERVLTPAGVGIVLFILTLLRVLFLFSEPFDLYGDEAQYWGWAQILDFGYYSKPPVVAWAIALTTSLCGDGEACVRLASPFAWFVTSLCVYGIGRSLFDARVAAWSAITFATLPAVTLSSALISTDPFLLMFWALAMLGFMRALKDDAWHWWLFTGVVAGFGLLSKYTMGVFGISALFALLILPEHRSRIWSPKPYVGAFVAFLIYAPNLWWNIEHDFVSYAHTGDNAAGESVALHPAQFLEFIGGQFIVFGPLLFAGLLWQFMHIRTVWSSDVSRKLLAFVLPLFVLIAAVSLFSRAHANWAGPIYIAATLLVVAQFLKSNIKVLLPVSLALHVLLAIGFYAIREPIELAGKEIDPYVRVRNGDKLGQTVMALQQQFSATYILADERRIAALLTYYISPHPYPVVKWNGDADTDDWYDMTTTMEDKEGQDFLLVTRQDDVWRVLTRFGWSEKIATLDKGPGGYAYHIYHCRDFRGY